MLQNKPNTIAKTELKIVSVKIVHFYPNLLMTNPDINLPIEKTIAEYSKTFDINLSEWYFNPTDFIFV